ncbi:heavy-metal-associated domain-containing protein [Sporolactobacillus shoreicorticis]|uniref:Heavy-metal-associated domain-containing protein n=1 Tax=Sporolactobacillus shoreicorticis TaxID=1923877 RepID=A0ABW5S2Q6_9BACL|nr:heavy metal-associated domain-containing protein [Sporolactobacillus shoreicorticis]MCO7126814.1 heavy-metal-associated domain-containing protein [Sporolactobacillus shoreicorticis]
MATFLIVAFLIILAGFALRSTRKKMRSGCCGSGDVPVKKIKVHDRNAAHYPYVKTLQIDGMTCQNCVIHIENALNTLDGVLAKASLDKRLATVHMRHPLPADELRRTVSAAGYTVMRVIDNGSPYK